MFQEVIFARQSGHAPAPASVPLHYYEITSRDIKNFDDKTEALYYSSKILAETVTSINFLKAVY